MTEGLIDPNMTTFQGKMPRLWAHLNCWACTWRGNWQAENSVEVELDEPEDEPEDTAELLRELVEITGAMEPVYGTYLVADSRSLRLAVWADKYKQHLKEAVRG